MGDDESDLTGGVEDADVDEAALADEELRSMVVLFSLCLVGSLGANLAYYTDETIQYKVRCRDKNESEADDDQWLRFSDLNAVPPYLPWSLLRWLLLDRQEKSSVAAQAPASL